MARFRVSGSHYESMASLDVDREREEDAIAEFKLWSLVSGWDERTIHMTNFDAETSAEWDREYREKCPWEEDQRRFFP